MGPITPTQCLVIIQSTRSNRSAPTTTTKETIFIIIKSLYNIIDIFFPTLLQYRCMYLILLFVYHRRNQSTNKMLSGGRGGHMVHDRSAGNNGGNASRGELNSTASLDHIPSHIPHYSNQSHTNYERQSGNSGGYERLAGSNIHHDRHHHGGSNQNRGGQLNRMDGGHYNMGTFLLWSCTFPISRLFKPRDGSNSVLNLTFQCCVCSRFSYRSYIYAQGVQHLSQ